MILYTLYRLYTIIILLKLKQRRNNMTITMKNGYVVINGVQQVIKSRKLAMRLYFIGVKRG